MMSLKVYILLTVAIVPASLDTFVGHSGTRIYGTLEEGAKVIYTEEVVEEKLPLHIVERKMVFAPQSHKISAIVVKDNNERYGGKPYLIQGGPPGLSCILKFTSARNHGLNFTVQIYDMPPHCKNCKIEDSDSSMTFGVLKKGAPLLHKENILEPKKLGRVVERRLTFDGQAKIISAIVIKDNNVRIGGISSMVAGGPSKYFTTLKFASKRNYGIDYTVEIYGV